MSSSWQLCFCGKATSQYLIPHTAFFSPSFEGQFQIGHSLKVCSPWFSEEQERSAESKVTTRMLQASMQNTFAHSISLVFQ